VSEITVRIPPGASVDVDDFTDLAGQTAESITPAPGGGFTITFPEPLTPAQETAVRRRAQATNAVEELLLARAENALAANKEFLEQTTHTNPVVVEQVKDLTRQVNALIRLVTRTLDEAD
jgi:hypothetical protein